MAKINDLVIKSNKNDAWKDFFPQSRLSSDVHSRVLWLIHTVWDQDRDGTGNGAGTIGNNGSGPCPCLGSVRTFLHDTILPIWSLDQCPCKPYCPKLFYTSKWWTDHPICPKVCYHPPMKLWESNTVQSCLSVQIEEGVPMWSLLTVQGPSRHGTWEALPWPHPPDIEPPGSAPPPPDLGHLVHGDPLALAPPPACDIWWPSMETSWNLFIWPHCTAPGPTPRDGSPWLGPSRLGTYGTPCPDPTPSSDIWWPSLETSWNLFIGPHCTAPSPIPRDRTSWFAPSRLGTYRTWGPTTLVPPLLVTSGGHHWRPVETCSLDLTL